MVEGKKTYSELPRCAFCSLKSIGVHCDLDILTYFSCSSDSDINVLGIVHSMQQ